MALSDFILKPGEIIVTKSTSTVGLAAVDSALNFGTVQYVNQFSNKTTVGQSVMFDTTKGTQFMYISGITYYLINEDDVTGVEPAA